jgi:hypothetical protein
MSEPSISAQSLVRYIGARLPSERKSILRRQKDELAQKTVVPFYQQALKGIRDHHRDTPETLDDMLQRLTRSLDEVQHELERAPEQDRNKIRNRITRLTNNIRLCADYKEHFGDRVIKYKLRRCSGLIIAGVRVSGEFTLAGDLADRGGTGPCAIVVDTHADVPEAEDVKNHLELAYALAGGERGEIPLHGFQVWHPSSGRIWRMRQHSASRWKSVRNWCAYIAARWEQRGEGS